MMIREELKKQRLFYDGAFGTYYNDKYEEQGLSEKALFTNPERVKEVHKEYLRAGANIIRTNTFACNSMFFSKKEKVLEGIRLGYRLAQEAIAEEHPAQKTFVAADIGPIYDITGEESEEILKEGKEIVDVFLEEGADFFQLETFEDTAYAFPLCAYIKEKKPEAFVVASFRFDKSGYTKSGLSFSKLMEQVEKEDAVDAFGCNCGVEALHMFEIMDKTGFSCKKPVIALPNAGYPMDLRGRRVFRSDISYYGLKMKDIADLGVELLGGCCGTTPKYIALLTSSLKDYPWQEKKPAVQRLKKAVSHEGHPVQRSFVEKMRAGKKTIIVELDPPFDQDISKVKKNAELYKEVGVDAITLSDSPMARGRMDAGALASYLQLEYDLPVMPHMCCRDKNVVALRGAILANYMQGIRQALLITGDPFSHEVDKMKPVYNVNSIRFMQNVKQIKEELFSKDDFAVGGALNYHGVNVNAIAERMKRKMEVGCEYFLTQPLYSDEDVERVRYLKEKTGAKIFCGIMPLVSYKNACFLKSEMPGIRVPEETVERYHPDMSREEAEKVAVEVALEVIAKVADFADGYYFMTPFNRGELMVSIIEQVKKEYLEA